MSRPSVGILQRKTSTAGSDWQSFSSLSLLPHELNKSLMSGADEETDHQSRSNSIDSTNTGNTKIILQTQPRRGSAPDISGDNDAAMLIYNTSYGGKMKFSLKKKETWIGRKDDNDISLSCAKISKRHALILRDGDRYVIRDENSSNGLKINGIQIDANTSVALCDNDEILIGTISLTFIQNNSEDARRPLNSDDNNLKLVTILPSEKKYEETVTIRAEVEAEAQVDFKKADDVDINTLKEDYEKLRLAYELSKVSLNSDINELLAKSMDLIFDILPVDRGVVLLVDQNTGILGTHYVKLREDKANEGREILLSSTILRKVFYSRKCLISSDACEDPMLGKAASVRYGQIRSVICVPLVAHGNVHGILHLDSRDKIKSFSNKDLGLVQAISNQTSIAIENGILMKEVESKARITEQLSRFLAPQVVDRMTKRGDIIKRGGKDIVGTIIFVDIRGFTNLTERLSRNEIFNLLNDYFERLVRIVFKYNGVVDKFIGDALMAVFGSLEEEADSEFRAVSAAIEFKTAIYDMNEERKRLGKDTISIGVGLNTGELLAGFIGSQQRLEYTCIGDTVNTSSRICSMAMEDQVLISESTYEAVKHKIHTIPVGYRQFKGKQKEVMVYEALSVL